MLYGNGLSYKEIAEKLSVTEKAVDNALQRARKKVHGGLNVGWSVNRKLIFVLNSIAVQLRTGQQTNLREVEKER